MKMLKIKINPCGIIASIAFFSLLFSVVAYAKENNTPALNKVLAPYGIQFRGGGSYPVIKDFKYAARDKRFHTIVAQGGKTRIEIEIMATLETAEVQGYTRSKYTIIKNLYGPQSIPYRGAITVTTECPPDKKPRETTVKIIGQKTNVLIVTATDRYALGVWEDELIKQKAGFAVFYDKYTKTMYQIIVFQPASSFRQKDIARILEGIRRTRQ